MMDIPKPCGCVAELIGLSDGSSVYGWKCSKCGHAWPRTPTERGMWKFENPGGMDGYLKARADKEG